MQAVALDEQEWQQVMAIISTAPWRDANPLLMKIGNQLRQQHDALARTANMPSNMPRDVTPPSDSNGKEVSHE